MTLCNPMDCSTPGFRVLQQLPELAQTHVCSHPLSSPSPPAFSLSQHQSLFQWVSSLHQVAKVLELQLQHQSFQCQDSLKKCYWRGMVKSLSRVWLFATPWTVAYQASPSMGFSRQEYWSELPFPSPMHESEKWKWKWSRSVVSSSLRPHGL